MEETLTQLLSDWCDGLLRRQMDSPSDTARHGGLFCPDCGCIHGRCADALYPFLRMARQTGEEKYLTAAQLVFDWSERNVSQANGSFINDPDGNNWNGITVFSAIALAEALHHHGALLPEAARLRWTERLARAAHWIRAVDWADHGTINYPISAAAALAGASRVLNDSALLQTARHWADWARAYFLPDGILFGEGPRTPTARGVYAVDALYNVEESLPNFALYAEIAADETARSLVLSSFAAHLDFLLPDGFYDAGWGSRSFKWTLWGSRTSDGIAGLLPLAHRDARIFEAVRRNIEALRICTHDGLLYGGPHLKAQRPPCIHHTFCHAKALAAALDGGVFAGAPPITLPAVTPRGIAHQSALGTTFVWLGDWRASFTVSDVLYQKPGLRPSGGSITMLWHKATGPLCVSSMSVYERIEGGNMAKAQSENEIAVLTPRIDSGEFSSVFDEKATLESGEESICAAGHLTTLGGDRAGNYQLETRFSDNRVVFHATAEHDEAAFILPVVSPCDETVEWSAHRVVIHKHRARVVVEASAPINESAERIFHFVPGVQAVRLTIPIPPNGLDVSLTVLSA